MQAKYLGYVFHSLTRRVLPRIETAAHGTKRLTTEVLRSLEIPILPETEQLEIIEYLDAVQQEIQAMQKIQAQDDQSLEQVEQAILAQAFQGEL